MGVSLTRCGYFKKVFSRERVKPCFINIPQKMRIFFFNISNFHQYSRFLAFPCYKESNDVNINLMMWAIFFSLLLSNCVITYTRRPPLVKLSLQGGELFLYLKISLFLKSLAKKSCLSFFSGINYLCLCYDPKTFCLVIVIYLISLGQFWGHFVL